ncbi:helix-turn-helix domain-containing protein [Cloacibacillus porcorum]
MIASGYNLIMTTFGERLKFLRGKKTGREVAEKAGITQAFYSEIERGIKQPSLDTAQRLAEALDTTVGYLIGETDDSRVLQNDKPDTQIIEDSYHKKKSKAPRPLPQGTLNLLVPSELLIEDPHAYEELEKQAREVLREILEKKENSVIELKISRIIAEANREYEEKERKIAEVLREIEEEEKAEPS